MLPALGIKDVPEVKEHLRSQCLLIYLTVYRFSLLTVPYSTVSTQLQLHFQTTRMPSSYEILGLSEDCTKEEARERLLELSQKGQVVDSQIMDAYIQIKDFSPSFDELVPLRTEGWSLVAAKKKTPSRPLTKNDEKRRRPSLADGKGHSLNNDAEGKRFGEVHFEENAFEDGWWEGDIVQKQKATEPTIKSKAKKTKAKTAQPVADYGNPNTPGPGPSSWS